MSCIYRNLLQEALFLWGGKERRYFAHTQSRFIDTGLRNERLLIDTSVISCNAF